MKLEIVSTVELYLKRNRNNWWYYRIIKSDMHHFPRPLDDALVSLTYGLDDDLTLTENQN